MKYLIYNLIIIMIFLFSIRIHNLQLNDKLIKKNINNSMRRTQTTKQCLLNGFAQEQSTLKEIQLNKSLHFISSDIISSSPLTFHHYDKEEYFFLTEILSIINESIQITIEEPEEEAINKIFTIMDRKPINSKSIKLNRRIIPNSKRDFYSENYNQITQNSTKGDTDSLENSKKP